MNNIKVALVGVGNCASSLVQGVQHYTEHPDAPGLMTKEIGGYTAESVEFVAAFDVNKEKIDKDLNHAIMIEPNNADMFTLPHLTKVKVTQGPLLDGIGPSARQRVDVDLSKAIKDTVRVLKESKAEVMVNFLPVGSEEATRFYADCALQAGCAFINCIPVFIARSPLWPKRFRDRGLPLIGDDVKSQVGATIVHRALTKLFADRGIGLDHTYQLNVGGNMDFLNMKDQERLESKRASKTEAVRSVANGDDGIDARDVQIGPSDYVEWLEDQKLAFINLTGVQFGGFPLELEMRLKVHDSPNSAGVVLDAIRYAKVALDQSQGGVLESVSAWLMKAPPHQLNSDVYAREMVDTWLERLT